MTNSIEDPHETESPEQSAEVTLGPTKRKRQNRSRKAQAAGSEATPLSNIGSSPEPVPPRNPNREPMDGSLGSEATTTPKVPTGEPAGSASAPKGTAGARPKPKSLQEFIDVAYTSTAKLTLSFANFEELEKSVTASVTDGIEEYDHIHRLAIDDSTLRGLVNLLVPIAQHASKKSILRERVAELATRALKTHDLFQKLESHPKTATGLPDVTAGRVWLIAPDSAKRLGLSESQSRALRINSVVAFAMLKVIHAEWDADEFVDALAGTVWLSKPDASKRNAVAAAILAGAGDHDVPVRLGVLHDQMSRAVRDVTRRFQAAAADASTSKRRANEAEARVGELEGQVESLEAQLVGLREQLALTAAQLSAEREEKSVARSHHVDDYETLRTQIVRQLSKQTDLLSDGLHALRSGSYPIAEEFVDRALTAIEREVTKLRESGDDK